MTIDAAGIRGRIPHRDTMLLLDEVLDVEPGRRVLARRTMPAEEGEAFATVPLALVLESFNQAAAILATWGRENVDVRAAGEVPVLGSASDVVVHGPVAPGEPMLHEVRVEREIGDTVVFSGTTTVGGHPVLEVGTAVLARRPAEALRAPERVAP